MADARTKPATEEQTGWSRWVPGLAVARTYRPVWLRHDLLAGLVLTAILVPAGMGYAEASGLQPIYGLYASIVPLVVYAFLGPSRILVLGPDSSLSPLILAAIVPLAGADPAQRAALASMLAILAGAFCLAAGLARFGFITDLLSLPVRYGYLNGIALTVIVSQLPKLFGFTGTPAGLIDGVRFFVDGVRSGHTNTTALALGLAALALILLCRRFAPNIPGVLLAVVGSIVAVVVFGLADEGIKLVGQLPRGLPAFRIPNVGLSDLGSLVAGAVGIAIVSFADTSVLSRSYAAKEQRSVDSNQELVALGAANMVTGLFQGFSASASASRTPVAESAGARTQLTSVTGAVAIVTVLVLLPGLFRNLPTAALAAIVIAAALKLVEVRGVARLLRIRPTEFWLSIITFTAVAVFGVIPGVGIAVALSLLNFLRTSWRPYTAELVRVEGLKGYHDAARHPEGRRIPGLVLFRFDAPLFFANADHFQKEVLEIADRPDVRWIVVTAEPITDVDATGGAMLRELIPEVRQRDVTFAVAELKGVVRDRLARSTLVSLIGEEHIYRTIGEAVKAYVAAEHVEWTDWEDRQQPDRPASAEPAPPEAKAGDSSPP